MNEQTALHEAIIGGKMDVVEVLSNAGARIDLRDKVSSFGSICR